MWKIFASRKLYLGLGFFAVFISIVVWYQVRLLDRNAMVLASSGKASIELLNRIAAGIKKTDLNVVMEHYSHHFRGKGNAVWREISVDQQDGLHVYRWAPDQVNPDDPLSSVRACWGQWMQPMADIQMSKFKLDSVEHADPDGNHLRIRSILWVKAFQESGETIESQARFRMWLERTDNEWRVVDQHFLHGETVTGNRSGFADVSSDVGLDFVARVNPMYQTPEWDPKRFGIFKYSSAGVSAGDYNADGYEDLFFCDGANAALYHNDQGRFRDVTEESGLRGKDRNEPLTGFNVALFLDLDNDGASDLFMGGLTVPSRIYRNRGDGTFEDVTQRTPQIPPLTATASAADYDNDGDLDIYLGRYLDPRVDLPTTLFYTRNSAGNSLLRNDGNFVFTDVTEEAGVREGGLTLGVAWGDYDKDGDQDLYVANDFGRNALLRNDGNGRFNDVTAESGTMDFGFGMSATFGDVDNDGDLDIYVSNVHSGQRWYGQAATLHNYLINSLRQGTFLEDGPIYWDILSYTGSEWQAYGDRMVKGNSLLLNQGDGRFVDHGETSSANPFGWYWGSAMFDYDNDGLQDIYAANGWVSGQVTDDL